jgi:60 kDa SS-A/Ro ribonucleoprotein
MSKYNSKSKPEVVKSHQGGESVYLSSELELVALLATGLDGKYYEKESAREDRLIKCIKEVGKKDPELVAKALIYARSIMGQRSVTHVGAVASLSVLKGNPIAAKFFSKRNKDKNTGGIIFRMDDMLEIVSYYFLRNPGKPLPNAIKRGFKIALESADTYELAKYQGKGKTIKMVDLVNLVHPKPSEKMAETFKKLMKGELKQFNTAEDKNTKSGQEVSNRLKSGVITKDQAIVELNEAKSENWTQLIKDGTIGYLALLRNLRNIAMESTDAVFVEALNMLTNPEKIRQSLVFPHQLDLAFEVLINENTFPENRRVRLLIAVDKAYELSISNLKELFNHGRTAVVVDTSGSMVSEKCAMNGNRINSSAIEKASLIAATLSKGIGADLYHFSDNCSQLRFNPSDTVNTIKNGIIKTAYNSGTSFNSIFRTLNGKYDRVFVISDMQGGDSIIGNSSYKTYVLTHGQPYVYSVNICGYATTMFKANDKLVNLFGYSKDIYEMIKTTEINPSQILDEIRKIVI